MLGYPAAGLACTFRMQLLLRRCIQAAFFCLLVFKLCITVWLEPVWYRVVETSIENPALYVFFTFVLLRMSNRTPVTGDSRKLAVEVL